jgi:hypothetical protein
LASFIPLFVEGALDLFGGELGAEAGFDIGKINEPRTALADYEAKAASSQAALGPFTWLERKASYGGACYKHRPKNMSLREGRLNAPVLCLNVRWHRCSEALELGL